MYLLGSGQASCLWVDEESLMFDGQTCWDAVGEFIRKEKKNFLRERQQGADGRVDLAALYWVQGNRLGI